MAPKYPYLCVTTTAPEQIKSQNKNSPASSASGPDNRYPTDPERPETLRNLGKLIGICERLALAPNVDILLHLAKLEAENVALRNRAVELALEIQGLRETAPLLDRA